MSVASTLTAGRRAAESRMTSRATIMREDADAEPVTDEHGYTHQPWLVLEVDLPLRLAGAQSGPAQTRSVTSGGVEVQLAVRTAHVPVSTTGLQDGDVIEVTSGENEGVFLRIVEATHQDQATARRLPVVEIDEPEGWFA